MIIKKEDSLEKRYFYKLFTNIISFLISIITVGIIPRGLGPKYYGDFNFLTNFFNNIVGFLEMGTSTCFYTKLSQRPNEAKLVSFYFNFIGIIFLMLIAFLMIIHFSSFYNRILPDQKIFFIYLAAGVGFIIWLVNLLNQMIDAYGLTVYAELSKLFQKSLGLIIILILYYFNLLNLKNFFYYQYVIMFFLLIVFIHIMNKNGYYIRIKEKLSLKNTKDYIKEFYQYTNPIFLYSLIAIAANIFDGWLLQVFSGSIQQGFFGLSYQIGTICSIFTVAMTPLLTREFSIAHGANDFKRMAMLFRKYIPMLYSIAAYFSCFIVMQSDKFVYIFGGNSFKGAITPVAIMAFYPIHQTYGQLSGSVFYATGQTRLYRDIGIIFSILGLIMTYIFIAPTGMGGLGMGAIGLAIKMVSIGFIGVNVQLYFNARYLKLSFLKYFGHQIVIIIFLTLCAGITTFSVDNLLNPQIYKTLPYSIIIRLLLSGMLYSMIVGIIVYYFPILFGLKKDDIRNLFKMISGNSKPVLP